jgi:hypothetical protein
MKTRRSLLRAAGRLAAVSAFSPFVNALAAPGAPFTPPKNLVLVYHPMGLEPGWKPTVTDGRLTFSGVLSALQPFAQMATVVHGLKAGIRSEVMAHAEGITSLWTGSLIAKSDAYATSPSVDQLLVERLQPNTPLPSLELGVQTQEGFAANGNAVVMVYGRQGKLPAEDDPQAAFNRLFITAASPAELTRVRQERASVLDLVRADAQRVKTVIGRDDQRKLDAHLEGLRALEQRFDALAGLRCESAMAPAGPSGFELKRTERFGDVAALQEDVLAQALKCGVTRVASLQYSNTVCDRRITGVNPSLGYHSVMHGGTRPEKALLNRYFAGRVASLLGKLQQANVLQDTLVVWGSEMAIGNHLRDPIPFFVFGGRPEGYFQHGRLLEAPGHRTMRLLLSVLHAFGLDDVQTLGDLRDESSRGPLPGISRVAP